MSGEYDIPEAILDKCMKADVEFWRNKPSASPYAATYKQSISLIIKTFLDAADE